MSHPDWFDLGLAAFIGAGLMWLVDTAIRSRLVRRERRDAWRLGHDAGYEDSWHEMARQLQEAEQHERRGEKGTLALDHDHHGQHLPRRRGADDDRDRSGDGRRDHALHEPDGPTARPGGEGLDARRGDAHQPEWDGLEDWTAEDLRFLAEDDLPQEGGDGQHVRDAPDDRGPGSAVNGALDLHEPREITDARWRQLVGDEFFEQQRHWSDVMDAALWVAERRIERRAERADDLAAGRMLESAR